MSEKELEEKTVGAEAETLEPANSAETPANSSERPANDVPAGTDAVDAEVEPQAPAYSYEGKIADIAAVAATQGRILAVDFGDVRTGLAVCDAARFLASGIGFIRVGGIDKTVAETARIAAERQAAACVVGLPRNMNGSEGNRAERCKEFAGKLHDASGLPVMMTDERLTTVVAAHFLNETNTRGKDRKKVIDSLSAEIILQDTLDRIKRM